MDKHPMGGYFISPKRDVPESYIENGVKEKPITRESLTIEERWVKYDNPSFLTSHAAAAWDFMSIVAIDDDTGCWNWTGPIRQFSGKKDKHRPAWNNGVRLGYSKNAWRASYELWVEYIIPRNLSIENGCGNQKCVNPKHLEVIMRDFGEPAPSNSAE